MKGADHTKAGNPPQRGQGDRGEVIRQIYDGQPIIGAVSIIDIGQLLVYLIRQKLVGVDVGAAHHSSLDENHLANIFRVFLQEPSKSPYTVWDALGVVDSVNSKANDLPTQPHRCDQPANFIGYFLTLRLFVYLLKIYADRERPHQGSFVFVRDQIVLSMDPSSQDAGCGFQKIIAMVSNVETQEVVA